MLAHAYPQRPEHPTSPTQKLSMMPSGLPGDTARQVSEEASRNSRLSSMRLCQSVDLIACVDVLLEACLHAASQIPLKSCTRKALRYFILSKEKKQCIVPPRELTRNQPALLFPTLCPEPKPQPRLLWAWSQARSLVSANRGKTPFVACVCVCLQHWMSESHMCCALLHARVACVNDNKDECITGLRHLKVCVTDFSSFVCSTARRPMTVTRSQTESGKKSHINMNKFGGLSRDWVDGKILFICFGGVIPYGEKT